MKKSIIRNIALVLIIVSSFGSYVFLNQAQAQQNIEVTEITEESIESNDTRLFLPDVELISRIVETIKKHLPIL